jgi:hypothetical protein
MAALLSSTQSSFKPRTQDSHSLSVIAAVLPLSSAAGIGYIAFAWMACTGAIEKVTHTQPLPPIL